ncbi:uncharacterized protein LTR77_007981 [Saxophila tyrrhenica]|uniref:Zinc finger CHCC-type domain-containing protein n=1 Tax=Saxophila tyrrhenica TaxID=1690608 RepID=A0AAV9P4U4_9PEZI|nr:hypothetical protein LTR77_007981 [Saxophila tyrrhenica]
MPPLRPLRLLPTLRQYRLYSSQHKTPQTVTDNPLPANNPSDNVTEAPASSSKSNAMPMTTIGAEDRALQESPEEGEKKRTMQAPNKAGIWSRSQQPRATAMAGPRFEQTIMEDQPRPLAAIDLIHQQPVRWTKERTVSCDGGGGPLGHPRIFINVDKPQICMCTYCGLPFAHEHHRKHLESLPHTEYPLEAGSPSHMPAALPRNDQGDARTGSTEAFHTPTGVPYENR